MQNKKAADYVSSLLEKQAHKTLDALCLAKQASDSKSDPEYRTKAMKFNEEFNQRFLLPPHLASYTPYTRSLGLTKEEWWKHQSTRNKARSQAWAQLTEQQRQMHEDGRLFRHEQDVADLEAHNLRRDQLDSRLIQHGFSPYKTIDKRYYAFHKAYDPIAHSQDSDFLKLVAQHKIRRSAK